ncbi:MAG: flagellar hook-length control protein FliK [Candidatus Hydrogenedentes bacterium]|nr:flagellar hook-length control protein FliK [Candidatus Hydrogenedentota bacterium]
MLVETAPPAQEPRHGKVDADSYAYVSGAASFVTVLTEVNAEGAARDSDAPPRDVVESNVNTPENNAPEESEGVTEESATTTDETNSEQDETATSTPSPTDETGDTNSAEEETALDQSVAETVDENVEIPLDSTNESVTTEENIASSPPRSPNEVIAPPPPESDSAEELPASLSSILSRGAASGETANTTASSDGDEASPNTGQSPKPPFPKTLNALLAENAVKQQDVEIPTTRLSSEANRTSTATTEQAAKLDGVPDGAAPPPPQTTATELGGVRMVSPTSTPRIPLTNLPGEIAQQINLVQQQGTSTMRLRLSPENLGELRLEIQRIGDTVRVTMVSSSPQVRDALDSQMAELRTALEKQGLSLAEATVEDSPNPHDNDGGAAHKARQNIDTDQARTTEIQIPTLQHADPSRTHGESGGLNVLA